MFREDLGEQGGQDGVGRKGKNVQVGCREPKGWLETEWMPAWMASSRGEHAHVSAPWPDLRGVATLGCDPSPQTVQGITKGHVRDISGFLLSEENDFQARFWTHS